MQGFVRDLSYGFLLVPGLVAAVFIVVALLMVWVDGMVGSGFAFGGNAEAARQVLSIIATSLITVAGVAFSITIVTLQLVSTQFSPRALREFLRDRLNQIVAGVFVGTFAYCLLVLGSVGSDSGSGDAFVPGLGVSLAVVLGVANVGVLLVFIHHMSESIQITNISRTIATAGLDALDVLYPDPYGSPADGGVVARWMDRQGAGRVVHASRPGYIQTIAVPDIADEWARIDRQERRDTAPDARPAVHLRITPGDFVTQETILVEAWPAHAGGAFEKAVRRAVRVADARDIRQDVPYAVRQLVDIALRAISPSVNDPTTAVTCIGYVRAIMERLAARELPEETRQVGEDGPIVKARRRSFDDIATEAFTEIGWYGKRDPRVTGELLTAIEATAQAAARSKADDRVALLVRLAVAAAEPALAETSTDRDRRYLEQRLECVRAVARREPGSAVGGVAGE